MKPKLFLSFFGYSITISILFTSCYPGAIVNTDIVDESRQKENLYYVRSAPNVPLLTEKNDAIISGSLSAGSKHSGADIQTSFMPGKHIGVIAGYSFSKNEDYTKFRRFELGSGYVIRFPRKWHFEAYGGLGTSKIKNNHATGSSEINLTHFFIQPAFAISNAKKTVQFALVNRFEGVNFKISDTSFSTSKEPYNNDQVTSLYETPFHILWQPGLVFRAGWQNFLFQAGYSFSTDLQSEWEVFGSEPPNGSGKGNFSLGMLYRFNTTKKNTAK